IPHALLGRFYGDFQAEGDGGIQGLPGSDHGDWEGFMKITEVKMRTPDLIRQLLEVWEGSVRATHLFLSEDEINHIKEYVPQALDSIAHLVIAEDGDGRPVAFMGVEDGSLEMLFIAPQERGKGLGKRLLQ